MRTFFCLCSARIHFHLIWVVETYHDAIGWKPSSKYQGEKDHVISPCWLLFLGLDVCVYTYFLKQSEKSRKIKKFNTTAAAAATPNAMLTTKVEETVKRQKGKGVENNNNQIKYAYCRRRRWMVFDIDFIIIEICFEHWFIQWTSKCVFVCFNSYHLIFFFFFPGIWIAVSIQPLCFDAFHLLYIVLCCFSPFAP